jgi:hypothetical protein
VEEGYRDLLLPLSFRNYDSNSCYSYIRVECVFFPEGVKTKMDLFESIKARRQAIPWWESRNDINFIMGNHVGLVDFPGFIDADITAGNPFRALRWVFEHLSLSFAE